MATRASLLNAAAKASEVVTTAGMLERIESERYTRVDPFMIAGRHELPVMLRPLDQLLGAFIGGENPGVLVNSARSAGLVHMTCAHELGHYFLGHPTTSDERLDYGSSAASIEQEADIFAYHLLAPRRLITRIARAKGWTTATLPNPLVIYQLALRLGMSYRAMVWTLSSQKLLSYPDANRLAQVPPREIKRTFLPDLETGFSGEVWLLDMQDQPYILEPRATDRFVVDLPNHMASGFQWTADQVRDHGFSLEPLQLPLTPSATVGSETPFVPGGGSIRYVVHGSGGRPEEEAQRVLFDFVEKRAWQGSSTARDRYEGVAEFEVLPDGLDAQTRQALLAGATKS
jgi:IrrE N-terminal-like domain